MRFNILNRKVHYWVSPIIALPVLVILGSGVLLQLKKHWSWVQPVEHRGTGKSPAIDLEGILASVQRESALGVGGWSDINRIDVRPGRGVAKVWLHSGHEAQVDLGTGRVLHTAYRRSDLIESIHDGSFFAGDWTKLGLFLPSGLALLLLWASGLWMFWVPLSVKLKKQRKEERAKERGHSGMASN